MQVQCGAEFDGQEQAIIRHILRTVREILGLDVAFVGQFTGDSRAFRVVDSGDADCALREGDSVGREDTFCQRVVDGRLPSFMADASAFPEAAALLAKHDLKIGTHLSAPIVFSTGQVYGTFCCFSHGTRPSLDERDLDVLRAFAALTAERIERSLLAKALESAKSQRIQALLSTGGPAIVYQPVYLLDGMRLAGTEALARFPDALGQAPDVLFRDAKEVGLQVEMELAAIRNALAGYREVWRVADIQLGLNACAETILDGRFAGTFDGYPQRRIVIELTEHDEVHDYAQLRTAVDALRSSGMKIAIDDVGAGYASMRHVLELQPDILKLDVRMVRGIDHDPMRRGLVGALKLFADGFGSKVVAEGVETVAELNVLIEMEMQAVQGYLLGRPQTVSAFLSTIESLPRRQAGSPRNMNEREATPGA